MKERPILFSGPMVRALLAGTKTQTRRIVKPEHLSGSESVDAVLGTLTPTGLGMASIFCPHGRPGDRLWVKETFSAHGAFADAGRVSYRADFGDDAKEPHGLHWKPSIFCTRRASRITLAIVSVRAERLNDISEADAKAEGLEYSAIVSGGRYEAPTWRDYSVKVCDPFEWFTSPVDSYRTLWESINGAGSWALNPWVWVIEFRRVAP